LLHEELITVTNRTSIFSYITIFFGVSFIIAAAGVPDSNITIKSVTVSRTSSTAVCGIDTVAGFAYITGQCPEFLKYRMFQDGFDVVPQDIAEAKFPESKEQVAGECGTVGKYSKLSSSGIATAVNKHPIFKKTGCCNESDIDDIMQFRSESREICHEIGK
jgi:hypothetical protein